MAKAITFDQRGMRRATDSIRMTEAWRKVRRGLLPVDIIPTRKSVRVGKIVSATETGVDDAAGNPVQWTYTIQEVKKGSKGYGGWTDDTERFGPTSGIAYNMAEDANDGTGTQGNGVDHDGADYPPGFTMQPIPVDSLVEFFTVATVDDENDDAQIFEAWITNVPNGEDGTCDAP